MHSIAAASSAPSAAALCCRAASTTALTASAVASAARRGRRPHHPPSRHISRSRRADSPPSATPHSTHGHHHPMVGTTEGVLNLISKLSTNLDDINTAGRAHHMPSFSPSGSPFPSTTSSTGLDRQPVLPSFTPSSATSPLVPGSTTSFLPSPPPTARKAEALSKLNAVDLGSRAGSSSALGQGNDIGLASAMGAFGVAGSSLTSAAAAPAALPQYHAQPQELKIDMSFLERVLKLEEPLAPSDSSSSTLEAAEPKSTSASASAIPTFSTATDADWDALFSTTASSSSSSSSAPTQPATAANQVPDLTHLTSHLQSVKSRASPRSSTLSLLARIPSASSSLTATSTPILPPRLSTDDLNSLRIHLHASSTSPIHLRAFLATLFRHLPLPPSVIVADAIKAAADLGQPGLAHAIVAQIRRDHGLLGLVTCVSPSAFEHLITMAWQHEKSMPRVVKWMYEMQRVGVKPTPGLAGMLDVLLARCTAPAAIEAQVGRAAAEGQAKVPSEREANWLWTVLCELNWTRYLASARVSLDKASESGSMVRGPRVPRDRARARALGAEGDGQAQKESPLFSSQSLADLIRSAGVSGVDDGLRV